jgi:hypothetical protein
MVSYPFSVFLRNDRPYYLVAFKNEKTGKFLPAISTKQTSKAAAIKTAWYWYAHGIPKKEHAVSVEQKSLLNWIQTTTVTRHEAEFLITTLKEKGIIKSVVLAGSKQDSDFIEFLNAFWDFDKSAYVQKKLRKQHSIHRSYCLNMAGTIAKYWEPFF